MILQKLEARRRQAARIALYGSLVLVGALTWGVVKFLDAPLKARQTEAWMHRDYANLPEVKLLQKYAQIDTSETTGDEVKGAEFLARQFQAAGIPYRIEKVGAAQGQPLRLAGGQGLPAAGAAQPHRRLGGRSQGVVLAAVRGAHRAPLDLRPRRLRHEERRHRPDAGDDRPQEERRAADALGALPRHQQRGARQPPGHPAHHPAPPGDGPQLLGGAHRGRGGGGAGARRDQVLGDRVRPEALRRPDRLRRRPPAAGGPPQDAQGDRPDGDRPAPDAGGPRRVRDLRPDPRPQGPAGDDDRHRDRDGGHQGLPQAAPLHSVDAAQRGGAVQGRRRRPAAAGSWRSSSSSCPARIWRRCGRSWCRPG